MLVKTSFSSDDERRQVKGIKCACTLIAREIRGWVGQSTDTMVRRRRGTLGWTSARFVPLNYPLISINENNNEHGLLLSSCVQLGRSQCMASHHMQEAFVNR